MKEIRNEELKKVEGGIWQWTAGYVAGKALDKAIKHLQKKGDEIASGKVKPKPSPIGCTKR